MARVNPGAQRDQMTSRRGHAPSPPPSPPKRGRGSRAQHPYRLPLPPAEGEGRGEGGAKPARRGLVLVLVSGIVTLSMLLGLWFLQTALIGRRFQSARTALGEAGLAASSGMEYAAARLCANGYPGFDPSMRGRGDDWTYRQGSGVRVEGSANPSYSHGEPWADDGDGLFDPGPPEGTTFVDLDGDGRFSARSGRLRGTGGARTLSFALAIESPEGKLPVNAGVLWADDIFYPVAPGGIPDHKDLGISYHRGLAHALDNLGAILLPVTNDRRHWQAATGAPNPAHTFDLSYLGHDLIASRPAGGYKDNEEIRSALAPLGYADADLDAILPYINLGPYEIPGEASRSHSPVELNVIGDTPPVIAYVPVNLHAAPRFVLEALWRYVRADIPIFEGETDGWNALYQRAGSNLSFEALAHPHPDWNPSRATLQIFPDEATALAERVGTLRGKGPLSWPSLLRDFHDPARAALLFAADDAGFPPSAPLMRQGWTQAKARLAFQTVAPADGGYHAAAGLHLRPATLEGFGIDRFPDALFPARPGCQQTFGLHPLRALPFPDTADYPANADSAGTWTAWETPFGFLAGDLIGTQGGTVAPPARFSIGALGLSGGARESRGGIFRAAERVEFSCQEDFENLAGGVNLARRGIVPQPDTQASAEWRHDWIHQTDNSGYNGDNLGRTYARITTTPVGNIRSYTTASWGLPYWGFSRIDGAVALAPREEGLQQGAAFYWGVKRDFDGVLGNGGTHTPGPHGDFFHEKEPTSPLPDPPAPTHGSTSPIAPPYASGDSFYLDDCQAPGFDGIPPTDPIGHFTFEARMNQGSSVRIKEFDGGIPGQTISLNATRAIPPAAPEEAATTYQLSLHDSVVDGHWQMGGRNVACTVRDGDLGGDNPSNQHVALVVRSQANRTRFSIFVNGKPRDWETGSPVYDYEPIFTMTDREQISLTRCAEMRLHAAPLSNAQIKTLADADRFVRRGTFTSPLYALDEPARLKLAQWTGFRPLKADGTPAGSIVVQVAGYENPDGTGWSQTATLGGPGSLDDLGALGLASAVRSFRYTVLFDVPTADIPPPLCDSPVFESIWFTFARPGRAPRWEEPR